MRREVVELIGLGIIVGLAVFLVRALPGSPQRQWVVLAIVTLAIVAVLVARLLRFPRGASHQSRDDAQPAAANHPHSRKKSPFARELGHEWTGLAEQPTEDQPPQMPDTSATHLVGSLPIPTDDDPHPASVADRRHDP